MDQATLVAPNIERGRRLIAALDAVGFPVAAAYWLYLVEPSAWRLFIATPVVDKEGALKAYERLDRTRELVAPSLRLYDITVVSPADPLARRLMELTPAEPTAPGLRLTGWAVDGMLIQDGYLYRLPERYKGFVITSDTEDDVSLRAAVCWVNVDKGEDEVFRVKVIAPTRLTRQWAPLSGRSPADLAAEHALSYARSIIDSGTHEPGKTYCRLLQWDERRGGELTAVSCPEN